ncbi:MAG: hypothetical protein PHF05_06810 [Candidatus Izemoplasmatales bacterium]|nr:hypothetical protein [Candidatus Izemoplasmatales bacterium]
MKKTLIFILFIFFVFTMFGCENTTSSTINNTDNNGLDYSDFSELMILDPNLQLNMPESDYYLYFYGEQCTWCNNIKIDVLTTIALAKDTKIYLVRVKYFSDISEDIDLGGTPAMFHIVNGEVQEEFEGAYDILDLLKELT